MQGGHESVCAEHMIGGTMVYLPTACSYHATPFAQLLRLVACSLKCSRATQCCCSWLRLERRTITAPLHSCG